MKKHLKYIIISTALIAFNLQGQEKKVEKANSKFNDFDYTGAIASYEDLVEDGHTSEEVYKNLGDSNYMNANYKKASEWYAKLFDLKNVTVDPEYFYRYAQALKSLKKYEESDLWMGKFEKAKSNDYRAKKFSDSKDYLTVIKNNSGRYSIKNLPINSKESDFSPAFYNNELIFSSARDSGIVSKKTHLWNKKPFLNLYNSKITKGETYSAPSKFSKILNKKTHESSPVFTKDGKTMYFTRNNSDNGKFSRDDEGVSRLKLYKASLENDLWQNVVELPFNGANYSTAHPTLNADESKLYFASDMPGTIGKSDIFYVDINLDGSYGIPVNAGDVINTEFRETFPFISKDNILYFASDGYPGLGGLDVFGINLEYLKKSKIQNLGSPINSEQDDFSFIFNTETQKGYFASNRTEGIGSDDIYSFVEAKPLDFNCYSSVEGIVKDKKTLEIIPNTVVTLLDSEGEILTKVISDSQGEFSLNAPCENGDYTFKSTHKDYKEAALGFSIKEEQSIVHKILLESSLEEAGMGTDLTQKLNLDPIYFDFDKSYIRRDAQEVLERVLAYMKQYPEAKIEVRSHTDSRGNDSYNLRLSQKRAEETVAYLISKGVNYSRLSGEGYGETKHMNDCGNSSSCSKEQHQANRRSEFIVVK